MNNFTEGITPTRLLGLFMLALMLMLTQTAYAVEITGSMNANRQVKVGANECYRTIANVDASAEIKALGRNADGSWLFIWADAGDGWVPASSVNLSGDLFTLGVWQDHFVGESCTPVQQFDSRICGRDGNETAASTTRWTDIFATADPDTETGRAYPPNSTVTIEGRDFWGCWVQVSGSNDAGWVPINSLNVRGIMSLPVLVDNSGGCVINADGSVTECNN